MSSSQRTGSRKAHRSHRHKKTGVSPELSDAFQRLCDKVDALTSSVKEVHADVSSLKAQYAVLAAAAQGATHGVQMTVTFTPPPLRSATPLSPDDAAPRPILDHAAPSLPAPSPSSTAPPNSSSSSSSVVRPFDSSPATQRTPPKIQLRKRSLSSTSSDPNPDLPSPPSRAELEPSPSASTTKRRRLGGGDDFTVVDSDSGSEETERRQRPEHEGKKMTTTTKPKSRADGWQEYEIDDESIEVIVMPSIPSSSPTTTTTSAMTPTPLAKATTPKAGKGHKSPSGGQQAASKQHNGIFRFTDHLNDKKEKGKEKNEKRGNAKEESERVSSGASDDEEEQEEKKEHKKKKEKEKETRAEVDGSEDELEAADDSNDDEEEEGEVEPRYDQQIVWIGADVAPQGKPVNHRLLPEKLTKLEQLRDFWQRMKHEYEVEPTKNCWRGTGSRSSPNAHIRKSLGGKKFFAHALTYLTWYRTIDLNLPVVQLCGDKLCVNPKHLSQVADPGDTEERRYCLDQRSAAACPYSPPCIGHKA